jgi:7,8-dihydroneopterin aldolase/epimerase/oxygenase
MISVKLEDVRFYAYHGVHQEERKAGNTFSVDVELLYDEQGTTITSLEQTVNYGTIYEIIKRRMVTPTPLLETLAQEIGEEALSRFSKAEFIKITIRKQNAPIIGIDGIVSVSWFKNLK